MNDADLSSRQGHRLIQIGIFLFLFAALVGLAVPFFTVTRIALSAHLIGILQGIFLVILGLVWPRLRFGKLMSRVAFWLLVYESITAIAANLLAAVWGAGNSIIPLAAGPAHGSVFQEAIINIALRSSGAALIIALLLILWGLSLRSRQE